METVTEKLFQAFSIMFLVENPRTSTVDLEVIGDSMHRCQGLYGILPEIYQKNIDSIRVSFFKCMLIRLKRRLEEADSVKAIFSASLTQERGSLFIRPSLSVSQTKTRITVWKSNLQSSPCAGTQVKINGLISLQTIIAGRDFVPLS